MPDVFVSYSWDSKDHEIRVLSFTNHLRKNGFDAHLDKMLSQQETAINFVKMMHKAMHDYPKVIVVLSSGYKIKAESFNGGVGVEYELLINNINTNHKKYILVAFEKRSNSIIPFGLMGRDIVDLSNKEEENRLFRKLLDQEEYEFSPVAKHKPELSLNSIPKFSFTSVVEEFDNPIETTKNSYTNISYFKEEKQDIIFNYFLDSKDKNSLNVIILCRRQRATLDLKYNPKKNWKANSFFLSDEDPYYYSLKDFEKFIREEYKSGKKNTKAFIDLIEELNRLFGNGIESIAEFLFDYYNKDSHIPKYKDFIAAFESHTKLKKGKYSAQTLDYLIHFKTKNETFEMDTYQGKTASLKSFKENESYSEIYTQTEVDIWGEIYKDAGIEKTVFVPVMLREWENYWNKKFKEVKELIGRTDHLIKHKQESLRQLYMYFDLYNDSNDIIKLAHDFDELELYPIAVISMLNIFDEEVCYEEYCEYEFENGDWECIDYGEEHDWESPVFFIKPYDF